MKITENGIEFNDLRRRERWVSLWANDLESRMAFASQQGFSQGISRDRTADHPQYRLWHLTISSVSPHPGLTCDILWLYKCLSRDCALLTVVSRRSANET